MTHHQLINQIYEVLSLLLRLSLMIIISG